jgi:sRNA-binding protein
MVRALARVAVAFAIGAVVASSVEAGVKTEQKTQVQFGGLLGGIMNKFGGKAAKEGVVEAVAVAGDRKLTLNDTTGQIVDLAEEKIYDLDVKKKTYTVTTFAELKKRIEEQRAKAEKEAAEAKAEAAKQEKGEPQAAAKELEVDFEMKETGEKRAIAGFEARQVVMTATVREKGRTLPQSGGIVMKTDTWLAPTIAAMKEIEAFDRRYALKMAELFGLTGPAAAASMEQMTAMLAMYPGIHKAMEKVKAESAKVDMEGTPVATALTVTGVKSAAQVREGQKQQDDTGGGLGGMLARKMMKKQGDPSDPRSMLMTSTTELIKLAPDATAADVALPAGFKLR